MKIITHLPTHTCCLKCGARDLFMIGLYRCDRPDLGARRCGGVLRAAPAPLKEVRLDRTRELHAIEA